LRFPAKVRLGTKRLRTGRGSSFRTVASREAGEELTGKYLQRVLKELPLPVPATNLWGHIHGVSREVIPVTARAPKVITGYTSLASANQSVFAGGALVPLLR